jgi:hypothetical protein
VVRLQRSALAAAAALVVVVGAIAAFDSGGSGAGHERTAAKGSGSLPPLPGALLIADRGNNRLLAVDGRGRSLWSFPNARDRAMGRGLRFNDDAFVGPRGRRIVANEEDAHTIVSIDVRTHRLVHLYGVPGVRGAGPGLLNTPDDAYPLPDGSIVVADAYNCRVLTIRAHRIVHELGTAGDCRHDPPRAFGAVNGDTPLRDGGLLVSEIPGHWVDDIGPDGSLRAAIRAPVRYPSDPQPLSHGRILLADYSAPGHVVIMDRRGRALWRYGPRSGPGSLNHPSLALRLPNGMIAVNDDYRHRVVLIDPQRSRIVWQYGHTDRRGRARGFLNTPDGMDFVPVAAGGRPNWAAVHHP